MPLLPKHWYVPIDFNCQGYSLICVYDCPRKTRDLPRVGACCRAVPGQSRVRHPHVCLCFNNCLASRQNSSLITLDCSSQAFAAKQPPHSIFPRAAGNKHLAAQQMLNENVLWHSEQLGDRAWPMQLPVVSDGVFGKKRQSGAGKLVMVSFICTNCIHRYW